MSLSGWYARLPRPLARRLLRSFRYFSLMRAQELRLLEPWIPRATHARVLDVGCGHGLYSLDLARHGCSLVGLDLQRSSLLAARRSAQRLGLSDCASFVVADGTALPLPSQQFDLVICNCVLEHIVDDEAALAGMARALRPGGLLYLTVDSAQHKLALGFLEHLPTATRAYLLQPRVVAAPTLLAGLDAYLDELYGICHRYHPDQLEAMLRDLGLTILDCRFYLTGMGAAHYEAFHLFRSLDPGKGIGRLLYMFSSLLLYPLATGSADRPATQGRGLVVAARKEADRGG